MNKSDKITAIYVRVSSTQQSARSQTPDLKRWIIANFEPDDQSRVKWYRDSATGKNMDRPGWNRFVSDVEAGKVRQIVCWRLDRLGRSAAGLCRLFEDLQARKVNLISLKESIDLATPAGRLMAHVLASVAAYETELRAERVKAGQAAARAKGIQWGGSKKGRLHSITPEQVKLIHRLKGEGERITNISRSTGIGRKSIYRVWG